MSLFTEYLSPFTHWLQAHPHWALLITFLISLTESLAIIGSIVPGSVTMTAIGILAGSGIMRVDLTLLAGILGAVVGDSLSYALGYIYRDRLSSIWPFKKYPHWLEYGKEFFLLHGGKSVLIGRFFGPLRSIIPVIAGALQMKQWRFLTANIISAIGWSLLYIMPGVLIGAASNELSPESASRLFIFILFALAAIWVLAILVKALLRRLNRFLTKNSHTFWLRWQQYKLLGPILKQITPPNERSHSSTISLFFLALLSLSAFLILLMLIGQSHWLAVVNQAIHLFLQSVHTQTLALFCIFCTQLTHPITLFVVVVLCSIFCILHKKNNVIGYLVGLMIVSAIVAILLEKIIPTARPSGLLVTQPGSSFPQKSLLVASALYGFLLFYINRNYRPLTNTLRTFVFSVLILSGFASLYLGDHWFSDVLAAYFMGGFLNLCACLLYRKNHSKSIRIKHATYLMLSLFLGVLVTASLLTALQWPHLLREHRPSYKEFVLSEQSWWQQDKPILPIYRLNRIGTRLSLMNIQYQGDIQSLCRHLENQGWQKHEETFFTNVLSWIENPSLHTKLPIFVQLYENKAPVLMMTYTNSSNAKVLEFRLWASSYHLSETNQDLWIGSMHERATKNNKNKSTNLFFAPPLALFLNTEFLAKKIMLPKLLVKKTIHPTAPYVVLIKKKDYHPKMND